MAASPPRSDPWCVPWPGRAATVRPRGDQALAFVALSTFVPGTARTMAPQSDSRAAARDDSRSASRGQPVATIRGRLTAAATAGHTHRRLQPASVRRTPHRRRRLPAIKAPRRQAPGNPGMPVPALSGPTCRKVSPALVPRQAWNLKPLISDEPNWSGAKIFRWDALIGRHGADVRLETSVNCRLAFAVWPG